MKITPRVVALAFAAVLVAPQALAAPPEEDASEETGEETGEEDTDEEPGDEENDPPGEEADPDEPAADPDASGDTGSPEDDDSIFDDEDFEDEGGWGAEQAEPTYPRIEHKGYFRFRADMFGGLDLGTSRQFNNGGLRVGTSAVLPPLTENFINNAAGGVYSPEEIGAGQDESFLASANMRFRYQPTFLISPSWKFTATFDVLDNIVLGSTPDYHPLRPDAPLAVFAGGQAPPGDRYQFQDSIRVKELYGEWKILGIPLRFGRMATNWGLGMLSNDGDGWDDDFGDYNDRIMAAIQLYGIYIAGGYDIISSGPTYKQDFQPFGQSYDLTETDDVEQGFIAIFQRPLQKEEQDRRRELLVKDRKPAFDWGVYVVYRKQQLDVDLNSWQQILAQDQFPFDNTQLVKREAWAVIPDLWLRLEYRPSYTQRLRLELEFAMIIGEIGQAEDVSSFNREVLQWGLAFEGDYTTGGLTIGLDAGAASGDSADFLGVLDQKNFANPGGSGRNTKITNFKFDRNYHIDMILFREVIGTVTNAWYVKPYIRYDLFESPDGAIGGRLDVLVAGALEKDAYPGDDPFLGAEFDAKIFLEDSDKFYADLAFGLFIPGDAFDTKPGSNGWPDNGEVIDASIAWTLQTHIVLKY